MNSVFVVIDPESFELSLEVNGVPKQDMIKELPAHRPYESFDEEMRERHLRHRLDILDAENAEVRLPSVIDVGHQRAASRRLSPWRRAER